MDYRPLGDTGMAVSAVALGCWPIAGMTSPGVTDADSVATIRACFDLGINHLDTAHLYGRDGQSERLIAEALADRRDQMVIATKCGLQWGEGRTQQHDARPQTIRRQCEQSLERLQTDRVELLYLHAPDPAVPVAESAGAIAELIAAGKVRAAGASNVDVSQLQAFASACPLTAYQPPYNMLQRQIEADTLPWCRDHGVAVLVYWPLLKGLLAGRYGRQHRFDATDSRARYPQFQGRQWELNLDFVDRLRPIAARSGHSVAELVINWTIHQPGITAALCGAKRPEQIAENGRGAGWRLDDEDFRQIAAALADRGEADYRLPV